MHWGNTAITFMHEQKLAVHAPGGAYEIVVAAGALDQLAERLATLNLRGALWLISDTSVYPFYGPQIETRLRAAGYMVQSYTIPAGESSKDLAMAGQLYDWLIGGGVERRDTVLALGGGVVGDLAGFVAATVLRGIGLVQLPTTLLAMVDSAIGGKTGVNHSLGKNLIGAFYQPRMVLSDPMTLTTLPERELRAGWAEVIKHGVIRDAGLFEELEIWNGQQAIRNADMDQIAGTIWRAAKVKVDVVNADERESGERMLLNYGHTLGHAIESAAGYGTLLHGEAVAIGMDLEAQVAARLGMLAPELVERQRTLLHAYGLPTDVPDGISTGQLLTLTLRDKKVSAGKIRWALPSAIGAAAIRNDVPEALVRDLLES